MNKVNRTRTTHPSATEVASQKTDVDATLLTAPEAEQAATFDGLAAKRSSIFGHSGGDSRVVSPAGGGLGEVNNLAAIDGHSTKSGDFTEPRLVGDRTLFFTPEGARAVDALLERAEESSAPVRAENDPSFWERFVKGDPFAGLEQYSGKTE